MGAARARLALQRFDRQWLVQMRFDEIEQALHLRRREPAATFGDFYGKIEQLGGNCRVGLAPTGKRRLCTAHANSGHSKVAHSAN